VRVELKRLIDQISVAMGEDDTAKAEKLLQRDLANYLAQARDDIVAGEAVRDSFTTQLATRSTQRTGDHQPTAEPAGGNNGPAEIIPRPEVELEDHVAELHPCTAREAALLVVYEQDGLLADGVFNRLDNLGYDGADNYSTGLNRAKKAGWVIHIGRQYYLTVHGKEVAENLLDL
jgi:hypothetical protein